MPEKMSGDAERRLVGALEKVADLVADGSAPDEAIAKVASAAGLAPGHVQLMANAYNIGATTRRREDGSTPLDKAADFRVADASAIVAGLYPDTVKSAADVARASGARCAREGGVGGAHRDGSAAAARPRRRSPEEDGGRRPGPRRRKSTRRRHSGRTLNVVSAPPGRAAPPRGLISRVVLGPPSP
jgi:hypothetical protein